MDCMRHEPPLISSRFYLKSSNLQLQPTNFSTSHTIDMTPRVALQVSSLTSPVGIVLLLIGLFALIYILEIFFFEVPYPPNVPLVFEPEGARRFSWSTRLKYYTNYRSLLIEAHENVNLSRSKFPR